MSLQWTFVATFLYTEIFLCVLLMLPFISAQRWQKVFRSRLLNTFRAYANLYFNVFILVLVVLFFDAIRDVRRYNVPMHEADLQVNPAAETTLHMKLFRAQRNFYIAGFALFLFLVLRTLVTMISNKAALEANSEAAQKQAQSATAAAKALMEEKDNKDNEKEDHSAQELEKLKKELRESKTALERATVDLDAMKRQAESTNKEYDRLLAEHASVQEQLTKATGDGGSKKSD